MYISLAYKVGKKLFLVIIRYNKYTIKMSMTIAYNNSGQKSIEKFGIMLLIDETAPKKSPPSKYGP